MNTDTIHTKRYQVLLLYKYVAIENPQEVQESQLKICRELDLKGRIIVATEGINVTLEGEKGDVDAYCLYLDKDVRFRGAQFKRSTGNGGAFPRLSVRVRPEIVSAHLDEDNVDPNRVTGNKLSPDELEKWYQENKDFYVIDMRNDYEYCVGQFDKTVASGMKNFRDLKKIIKDIEQYKDKPVLTVCTGGVRCEKASGYLKQKGFKDVYQLDGGIHSYIEKYPDKHFKGSLYTFDQRKTYTFDNPEKHQVIGKCAKCATSTEKYADCAFSRCASHFLCCESCQISDGKAFCSSRCMLRNYLWKSKGWTKKMLAW